MTRKTKEEKKIAEYRRRLKFQEQNNKFKNPDPSKSPNIITDEKTAENPRAPDKVTGRQTYFAKDLKKSLLFICLIITLEIVIYFARMNR